MRAWPHRCLCNRQILAGSLELGLGGSFPLGVPEGEHILHSQVQVCLAQKKRGVAALHGIMPCMSPQAGMQSVNWTSWYGLPAVRDQVTCMLHQSRAIRIMRKQGQTSASSQAVSEAHLLCADAEASCLEDGDADEAGC